MSEANQEEKIVATLVDDEDGRMEFLPHHLGNQLFRGQNVPFEWMGRLQADYGGGMWQFFNLSNGGWYMAPRGDKPVFLSWHGNGFEGWMSPDAAGVVACIFALNQLAQSGDDKIIKAYYALMDFAAEHAEAGLISEAID